MAGSVDGDLDEFISELDYGEEGHSGQSPLMDFFLEFCAEEKKEKLKEKLIYLGVETLSDLDHVDWKDSFNDILKPVQVNKLMEKYKKSELLLFEAL